MGKMRLGDIAQLINGDRGKNYPSQSDIAQKGEIPFVNAGHLNGKGIDFKEMNYISEEKYNKLNSGKFQKDDILYCLRGSLGKKAIVRSNINGAIASSLVIIRPDPAKVSGEYLMFALDSPAIREQLVKANNGSSQPNLSATSVREYRVELPELSLQEEVVEKLEKVISIIDGRKQEVQLLDDLIRARFVEMFGDAVDNPMGWEKKQLQEIVTDDCTISYGIVQTGNDQEEGVPVFRPVDIVNRIPKLEELKRTTEEISNKYKRTILKGHEMLITVRANIADTCIVGKEFKGCNVGRGIVPIRTQENIMVLEFLKYLMDSKHLNDDIKSKAKGITLIQLNMKDLREVELIVPPIEQQKAFVEFAEQVNKSKVAIQKALDKTQMLFDSLMQEYFG